MPDRQKMLLGEFWGRGGLTHTLWESQGPLTNSPFLTYPRFGAIEVDQRTKHVICVSFNYQGLSVIYLLVTQSHGCVVAGPFRHRWLVTYTRVHGALVLYELSEWSVWRRKYWSFVWLPACMSTCSNRA